MSVALLCAHAPATPVRGRQLGTSGPMGGTQADGESSATTPPTRRAGVADKPGDSPRPSPNDNGPSPCDEGPLEGLRPALPGVADGTRTHDNQNHNLGLYQLSYSHRGKDRHYRPRRVAFQRDAAAAAFSAFSAFAASGTLISTLKRRLSAW